MIDIEEAELAGKVIKNHKIVILRTNKSNERLGIGSINSFTFGKGVVFKTNIPWSIHWIYYPWSVNSR